MAPRVNPPRLPPLNPNWRVRRRIVHATLAFCGGIIVYVLTAGQDSSVAEAAVSGAYLLAGAVIGSYVFGAVWEDTRHGRGGMDHWQLEDGRDWPRRDRGPGRGGLDDPDHRGAAE